MKRIINVRNREKGSKGITLIAMVITIIVLLILATVSIAILTGENGILNKATLAKEESKKKEYEEILKLIDQGLRTDKIINNYDNETYLKKFEEEIIKKEEFNNSKINKKIMKSSL